ncbi:MAG: hypothetical protein GXO69_09610 [Acidobacteria bacterium]|nr:hypothetical protein [Acidobacteriota bacterium]
MQLNKTFLFLFLLTVIVSVPVSAKTALTIKGKSLTPDGTMISLRWQVREVNQLYRFFLFGREKAQMLLKNGKVIKIRRLVRFQGKEKWVVLKDPLQISVELRSGFYPFSAVLKYRKTGERHTKTATGSFELSGSVDE